MKKRSLVISVIAFICVVTIVVVVFALINNLKFRIEEKYYNNGTIEEISAQELEDLAADKESFLLFVSQQDCRTSDDLRAILQSYSEAASLHILETSFSDLKSTGVANEVRFYPSFLIYRNGKLVKYLRSDSDEDVPAYTTQDGFESWLRQTVIIE